MVYQAARRIAQLDAAHEGLVFGRLDLQHERRPGAALHRPDRAARRAPRLAAHRLARARGRGVLPGDRGRAPQASYAAGCCAATGPRVVGVEDELLDAEALAELEADGVELPIVGEGALMAQLSRARDRSMHSIVATIQAEQDQAIRAPGKRRRLDLRRPRHRQDRGRAAPRGVPALHRPAPLRGRRRAGRRPERRLHALHRAGAPEPRRDRGRAALAGRGRRRRARDPPRRAGGRRRQGLGPDGELLRRAARQQAPGSPERVPGLLARRRDRPRPRRARPGPPPADVAGPAQPAAAPGRQRPARRDVAPGPRRARPRPGPRGVRRRHARRPTTFLDFAVGLVAAARRAARARLAARPRAARPGRRRACSATRSSGC